MCAQELDQLGRAFEQREKRLEDQVGCHRVRCVFLLVVVSGIWAGCFELPFVCVRCCWLRTARPARSPTCRRAWRRRTACRRCGHCFALCSVWNLCETRGG